MKLTISPAHGVPAPKPVQPASSSDGGDGASFAPLIEGLLDENGMMPDCTLLPPDGQALPEKRGPQPGLAPGATRRFALTPSGHEPLPEPAPELRLAPNIAPDILVASGGPSLPAESAPAKTDKGDTKSPPDEDDSPAQVAPGQMVAPFAPISPPHVDAPDPHSAAQSSDSAGTAGLALTGLGQALSQQGTPPQISIEPNVQGPTPSAAFAPEVLPTPTPALPIAAGGNSFFVERPEPPKRSASLDPPLARSDAAAPPPGAPVVLPAFQAFGAAIRQALDDERKPPRRDGDTPLAPATAAPLAEATAAPVAPGDPALDTADRRWPHAMAEQIERLRDAANENSTRIRLLPDALGPVDVAVRREGERVHVHFTAAQAETRQLLLDAQPRLADAADARGLTLGRTDVSADTAGGGQPQRAPAQPSQPIRPARARATATAIPTDTRIA